MGSLGGGTGEQLAQDDAGWRKTSLGVLQLLEREFLALSGIPVVSTRRDVVGFVGSTELV